MCTSRAPAARTSATSAFVVVPRTMESSTITTLLPSMTSPTALNLRRTLATREACEGWMNVRPT